MRLTHDQLRPSHPTSLNPLDSAHFLHPGVKLTGWASFPQHTPEHFVTNELLLESYFGAWQGRGLDPEHLEHLEDQRYSSACWFSLRAFS